MVRIPVLGGAMCIVIATMAWCEGTEEEASGDVITVTLLQRQDPLAVGDFRTPPRALPGHPTRSSWTGSRSTSMPG